MITVEPALPARCAFILLQWLDPSLPLPTCETRCGLSNSTILFFTDDSFVSLTPHLDIENRRKPRVTVRRVYHGSPISLRHNINLVSILHYVSPFMLIPGYYLVRAEFLGGSIFRATAVLREKPQLINVLRFATHAIIIHFQPHFAFGNRPFSRYN